MVLLSHQCVAQERSTSEKLGKEITDTEEQPSTLELPSFGLKIPILTHRDQREKYVGRVVAVRGPIGNWKIPRIIGVEVRGGHKLPDAFAIGILTKFVTTEEEWKTQPHPGGAGSFGPGTTFTLYHSLNGEVAKAKAWGTDATKDQKRITNPNTKKADTKQEPKAAKPKRSRKTKSGFKG